MKWGPVIVAAAAGAVGFWWWRNRNAAAWSQWPQTFGETVEDFGAALSEKIGEALQGVGMGWFASMKSVDRSLLNNRNVRAMLAVIRRGEGTAGAAGYQTLYGGGLFTSFADHPRKAVTKWGITSTAAGAYQFLARVWDETRAAMNLPDFSPASQDLAALGRIAARGALPDVLAGRFEAAISKLNREWASLPGSPYGQGTISMETARTVFLAAGGVADGVRVV